MAKYKTLIEETSYKEVRIKLPFYAYYHDEMKEIFVKITSNEFKRITFHQYGKCELFKCKPHSPHKGIADIWLENKSDWKQWQEAVRNAKSYLHSF